MAQAKRDPHHSVKDRSHDIIRGANRNDFTEVDLALAEDSSAITFQDEGSGVTALHVAAANGLFEMAMHLLQQPSADLTIEDFRGRTPLDMAIAVGHDPIIELFSKELYPKSYSNDPPDDD